MKRTTRPRRLFPAAAALLLALLLTFSSCGKADPGRVARVTDAAPAAEPVTETTAEPDAAVPDETAAGSACEPAGEEAVVIPLDDVQTQDAAQDVQRAGLLDDVGETTDPNGFTVYVSNSGGKIHRVPDCCGMKYYTEMTLAEALAAGYPKCKVCW